VNALLEKASTDAKEGERPDDPIAGAISDDQLPLWAQVLETIPLYLIATGDRETLEQMLSAMSTSVGQTILSSAIIQLFTGLVISPQNRWFWYLQEQVPDRGKSVLRLCFDHLTRTLPPVIDSRSILLEALGLLWGYGFVNEWDDVLSEWQGTLETLDILGYEVQAIGYERCFSHYYYTERNIPLSQLLLHQSEKTQRRLWHRVLNWTVGMLGDTWDGDLASRVFTGLLYHATVSMWFDEIQTMAEILEQEMDSNAVWETFNDVARITYRPYDEDGGGHYEAEPIEKIRKAPEIKQLLLTLLYLRFVKGYYGYDSYEGEGEIEEWLSSFASQVHPLGNTLLGISRELPFLLVATHNPEFWEMLGEAVESNTFPPEADRLPLKEYTLLLYAVSQACGLTQEVSEKILALIGTAEGREAWAWVSRVSDGLADIILGAVVASSSDSGLL